ncbi:MAG: sigma-70 family RNA polymerase sigma factor [Planctomycetota bacterium]
MDSDPLSAVTEAAFERWIDAFRGPLVGLIASWGADWGTAEELAVDTFAEAWIGRVRFQGDPGDLGAAGAWLRGIASRLWSASRRKLRPVAMAPETLPAVVAEHGDPAGTGMEEERRELLAAAFAELKPEHQSVLRMKYLEETTAAQLAALMGISVRAAEGRLLQARRMLRVKVNRLQKQSRGREVKA